MLKMMILVIWELGKEIIAKEEWMWCIQWIVGKNVHWCVATFNKDLNIVKKKIVSGESLKFLRKAILVSCEIVLYIFQVLNYAYKDWMWIHEYRE